MSVLLIYFDNINYLFVATLVIAVVVANILTNKNNLSNKKGERSKSTVFGDASFFDNNKLKDYFEEVSFDYSKENKLQAGWLVAENLTKAKAYIDTDDIHQMNIAPTGSGKTTKLTVKTVLYNLYAGINIVAVDPKNTFYQMTVAIAKKLKYTPIILNFKDTNKSEQWNILEKVNEYSAKMIDAENTYKETKEVRDEQQYLDWRSRMEQEVDELVEKLIKREDNKNNNEFFISQNQAILKSLIIFVSMYADPEEKTLGSVVRLLDTMMMTSNKNPFKEVVTLAKLPKTHPAINSAIVEDGSKETFANIRVSITNSMNQYKLLGLHRLLASNSFNIRDLINKKCILYVVVPEKEGAATNLASIFIDYLISELTDIADKEHNGKLPIQVRLIIEELCNISKITRLNEFCSISRSRNLLFSLTIQSRSQLIGKYGKEEAENIEHNCNLVNIMQVHCLDVDTGKLISERNGEYTTESASQSTSLQNQGDSYSYTDQLTAKHLTKTNEAIQFEDNLVYKTGNFLPIKTNYIPYYSKYFPLKLIETNTFIHTEQKPIRYFDYQKLLKKLAVKQESKNVNVKQQSPKKQANNDVGNMQKLIDNNHSLQKKENIYLSMFKSNYNLYKYMQQYQLLTQKDVISKLRDACFVGVIDQPTRDKYIKILIDKTNEGDDDNKLSNNKN